MTIIKPIFFVGVLPLALTGCISSNPKAAFEDVDKTVGARTGQHVQWMRDDATGQEIAQAVDTLLQTKLTAQSAVAIALLNNRTLQAEFDEIGVSRAELAQASRLRNPTYLGNFRLPLRGHTVLN